jgi:hypothetical protein
LDLAGLLFVGAHGVEGNKTGDDSTGGQVSRPAIAAATA